MVQSNPTSRGIVSTDRAFATDSEEPLLAVSRELAAASSKVALYDGRREKPAVYTIAEPQAAARLQAVLGLIERYRDKWSLPAGVRTVLDLSRAAGAQHRMLRR